MLLAALLVALPAGLVLLQPDLGSAAVIVAMGLVVVTVAGVQRRWLVLATVAAAALVVLALTTPLLSDYQRDRLTAFADPSADPQGSGYQTRMVRLAIGSGGMWGQGFMEGERTQAGAVPYQLNDFVFSVAGEELGFVGATGLIVLLGFVVVRVLVVASRAPDQFGRLVGVGVATWLAVQVGAERGHEPRAPAGHRPAAAVHLVRGVLDARLVGRGGARRRRPHVRPGALTAAAAGSRSRLRLAGNRPFPSGCGV